MGNKEEAEEIAPHPTVSVFDILKAEFKKEALKRFDERRIKVFMSPSGDGSDSKFVPIEDDHENVFADGILDKMLEEKDLSGKTADDSN